jgi:hypothetical protein
MSKKIRYFLIALCFLVFLSIAPLLVMYVGGWIYDSETGQFVKTGILVAKSDPTNTKIEVNQKIYTSKSGDIKFLVPKKYNVKIHKDGFFPWEKNLMVYPNQITWASPAEGKIFLLKTPTEKQILANQVIDFSLNGNTLALLQKNSFSLNNTNGTVDKTWQLQNSGKKFLASPDKESFIIFPENPKLSPELVTTSEDKTTLLKTLSSDTLVQFSPENKIYFIKNNTLFTLNSPFEKENMLLNKVSAFNFNGRTLYYISEDSLGNKSLFTSELGGQNPLAISTNLPIFKTAEIFSTFEKKIFLLLDNSIYKVNGEILEKLADDVYTWEVQNQNSSIVFSRGGELNFYNPFKNTVDFISRSSETYKSSSLNLDINYIFSILGNKIQATELDTRDRQNTYELYQGNNISKFILDQNNSQIFVLDGSELKSFKIR